MNGLFNISFYFTAKVLTCHCDGVCPENGLNNTCQTRPGGTCFSSVEELQDEATGELEPERIYGCMSPEDNGGLFQVFIFYPLPGLLNLFSHIASFFRLIVQSRRLHHNAQ